MCISKTGYIYFFNILYALFIFKKTWDISWNFKMAVSLFPFSPYHPNHTQKQGERERETKWERAARWAGDRFFLDKSEVTLRSSNMSCSSKTRGHIWSLKMLILIFFLHSKSVACSLISEASQNRDTLGKRAPGQLPLRSCHLFWKLPPSWDILTAAGRTPRPTISFLPFVLPFPFSSLFHTPTVQMNFLRRYFH